MKICVYAFSTTALFFAKLISASVRAGDDIEWSIIAPQGHFLPEIDQAVPRHLRCYLYENFDAAYQGCNEDVIQEALQSSEGLISSLMKDKDGYRKLDKNDQLRRAATIHSIYSEFIKNIGPDYVLFPDLEVVDGFILQGICQKLGIGILYFATLRFLGRAIFASDSNEKLPPYFGDWAPEDRRLAAEVIRRVNKREWPAIGEHYPSVVPLRPSLHRRLVRSFFLKHGKERLHATEETLSMRIARNFIGVTNKIRHWRHRNIDLRYFDHVSLDELPQKFIFYALHYTPESSINGLEPYYVDQTRAIDALLLALPPGCRLVVKEHPAMKGVRPLSFYQDLRRKPGLILLEAGVDTRQIMARASLIATVTGTIGLEAYLFDKPCVSFGRNFFSHLCRKAPALGALRECLQDLMDNFRPATAEEKEIEIAKLLNLSGDFMIGDPWYSPKVMSDENINETRRHLWRHLGRLRG